MTVLERVSTKKKSIAGKCENINDFIYRSIFKQDRDSLMQSSDRVFLQFYSSNWTKSAQYNFGTLPQRYTLSNLCCNYNAAPLTLRDISITDSAKIIAKANAAKAWEDMSDRIVFPNLRRY